MNKQMRLSLTRIPDSITRKESNIIDTNTVTIVSVSSFNSKKNGNYCLLSTNNNFTKAPVNRGGTEQVTLC